MWMLLSIVSEKIKGQSKLSDCYCSLSLEIMKHPSIVMKLFKVEASPDMTLWHIQADLATPWLLTSLLYLPKKCPIISVNKLILTCTALCRYLKFCCVCLRGSCILYLNFFLSQSLLFQPVPAPTASLHLSVFIKGWGHWSPSSFLYCQGLPWILSP